MITGSPPFGLFFSEMMILRAGFLGAARGRDRRVPGRARRAVLRLRLSGRAPRARAAAATRPTGACRRPSASISGLATTLVAAVLAVVSPSICPARCWR